MQAVQSAYVLTVAAGLAAEALGVGAHLDGQLLFIDDHVAVEVRYRYLCCRDQIQVVHLAVVHLTLLVGQLSRAVSAGSIHYRRRHDLRITGFGGFGEEEVDECALQSCSLTDIDGETGTRDLDA